MISSGFVRNKLLTNVYGCPMDLVLTVYFGHCVSEIQPTTTDFKTRMPANRRIAQRQLEILLAFAETNRDIALGLCSRGGQGNQTAQLAWKTLAIKLNAVGDGVTKTGDEWRRYWVEWKSKTKAKGADARRSAKKTGGGPNKLVPLSEFEDRILQLIGPVAVGGLPGVQIPFNVPSDQHTPSEFSQPSTSTSQPSTSTSQASNFPLQDSAEMEIEWLQDDDDDDDTPPPSPLQPLPTPSAQALPTTPQPPPSPAEQPVQPAQHVRRTPQRSVRTRDVPRWVLDLEERRIAVEDRHASALESLSATMATIERRLAGIEQSLSQIVDKLVNK